MLSHLLQVLVVSLFLCVASSSAASSSSVTLYVSSSIGMCTKDEGNEGEYKMQSRGEQRRVKIRSG